MAPPTATRRGCSALWMVVVAVAVGGGLIAMHSGMPAAAHTHGPKPHHELTSVAIAMTDEALHGDDCAACASHSSMTMVCAVLLLAAAGRLSLHVWHSLVNRTRLLFGSLIAYLRRAIPASGPLRRPPDLHALQVMRC